jgi:glycerol kinase
MAEKDLILIIDQGTTGTKAIVFDTRGKMISRGYAKLKLNFPKQDWVEVSREEIEKSLGVALEDCLKSIDKNKIAALGVTNQRETCTLIDIKTGDALYPFIVWQDRRTRSACETLPAELITAKTGLRPHPYFSASKIQWVLGSKGLRAQADYRMMTIDTYVTYLLTGKKEVVTDPTNASRTLLYNIHGDRWDEALCGLFGIKDSFLPKVVPNGEVVGRSASVFGLPEDIPIISALGDQQAAWVGSGALFKPTLKLTIGTGAFSIGPESQDPAKRGVLQTVGYHSEKMKKFGYEGVAFCSGMIIEWLENGKWIASYKDVDTLKFPPKTDILFFPFFTEMGTPYWKPAKSGASFSNLTLEVTQEDVVSAAIMSIAFQNALILEQYDLSQVPELYLDGGVSQSIFVQKLMASLVDKPIRVSSFADITSLGVLVSILKDHMGMPHDQLGALTAEHFTPLAEKKQKSDTLKNQYEVWKRELNTLLSN